MQTVVLAAGEGTRMRPLTATRPKPMLPVAGRPLVEHTLEAAIEAGASRLILVVGYHAEAVQDVFNNEYEGVPIEYVTQKSQDGTADAVRVAQSALDDAPFAVLNGDTLYGSGMANLFDAGPAVGTTTVDDPRPYGVLEFDGNRVVGVVEKPADPPSNRINTGAYAFPAEAVGWLDVSVSQRGEYELTDVLERACTAVDVRAVSFDRWMDVGRPWELLEANEWKLSERSRRIEGDVHETAELTGRVVVEPDASVRAGVTIEGPVVVGAGASVGPNAYVRGATTIGEGVNIGHAVEVKNSVIMAGTEVPHLSYVGDSLIGRAVNLGAGTITANLRHDDAPVEMTVKGERVSTGRRKFGIVVGDGAKTGINTSVNAGVVLSAGARTEPGESVLRDR